MSAEEFALREFETPLARDLKSLTSETRSGNSRKLPLSDALRLDNSFEF